MHIHREEKQVSVQNVVKTLNLLIQKKCSLVEKEGRKQGQWLLNLQGLAWLHRRGLGRWFLTQAHRWSQCILNVPSWFGWLVGFCFFVLRQDLR